MLQAKTLSEVPANTSHLDNPRFKHSQGLELRFSQISRHNIYGGRNYASRVLS